MDDHRFIYFDEDFVFSGNDVSIPPLETFIQGILMAE